MASRNSKGRMLYWKISYCKQLARCSHIAQLLFTWGIPNTDDLGRMEGDVEILKGTLFPFDKKVTEKNLIDAIKELAAEKLILWYKVGENWFIQYPNFDKYQKLRTDREYSSDYPSPDEADMTCHDTSGHVGQNLREVKRSEGEEKENIYTQTEQEIVDFWNSKDVIKHGESKEIKRAIQSCKFKKEQIFEAIEHYSVIYHDEKYFYNHKWRLDKFLKQKNGLRDFLSDGQQWIAYQGRNAKEDKPRGHPVPQKTNFEQREHDDGFYNKFFDNKEA